VGWSLAWAGAGRGGVEHGREGADEMRSGRPARRGVRGAAVAARVAMYLGRVQGAVFGVDSLMPARLCLANPEMGVGNDRDLVFSSASCIDHGISYSSDGT